MLKGNVACEMSNHELLITELVLRNALDPLQPAEIAALLSCFVYKGKDSGYLPNVLPALLNVRFSYPIQTNLFQSVYSGNCDYSINWRGNYPGRNDLRCASDGSIQSGKKFELWFSSCCLPMGTSKGGCELLSTKKFILILYFSRFRI